MVANKWKVPGMFELKQLSICNLDDAVILYRLMIEENRQFDDRLRHLETDDHSIRNLLKYSFDIENDLVYIAYLHNERVGFIDSARVSQDNGQDEWYIKAVYLLPLCRDPKYFEILVNKIERSVEQKGIQLVFSNALMENSEVNRFWESAGYELTGNRRVKLLKQAAGKEK